MEQLDKFTTSGESLVYSAVRKHSDYPEESHEQLVYSGTDRSYAFSFAPNSHWDRTLVYVFSGKSLVQIYKADHNSEWEVIFNLLGTDSNFDGNLLYDMYYTKALKGESI